jgi:PhnB protein
MKLIPYLNFQGDCEEALNTYKKIFNGKVDIVNRYDNPAMNAPDNYKNKILHARLFADEIVIYASDVMPGKEQKDKTASRASLSLDVVNSDKAGQIFDLLAEGGKVNVPFAKQFWGGWHGNLVDRFGISWMVNCE